MTNRRFLHIFLSLVFLVTAYSVPSFSKEYWEKSALPLFSSGAFSATDKVVEAGGIIYIASGSQLAYSEDGINFEEIRIPAIPNLVPVVSLYVHKGLVYFVLRDRFPSSSDYELRYYRIKANKSIEEVYLYDSRNGGGVIGPSFSLNNYVYTPGWNGSVFRTTGEGTPLQWDQIESIPDRTGFYKKFKLFSFKGDVFMSFSLAEIGGGIGINTYLYRLRYEENGTGWELVGSYTIIVAEFFEWDGKLYATKPDNVGAITNYLYTRGKEESFEWYQADFQSSVQSTSINIFDKIHVFTINQRIHVVEEDGTLNPVSEEVIDVGFLGTDYFVGEKAAYVLYQGNLWTLNLGAKGIKSENFIAGDIIAGEQEGTVLKFTIEANIRDNLSLVVRNLGTAVSGQDISQVYLKKTISNPPSALNSSKGATEILAELEPVVGDLKSWKTKTPIQVEDGDEIFVTILAANEAQDNATVNFVIFPEDISFEYNSNYSRLEPLGSFKIQSIKKLASAAGLDLSGKVLIYPQPASDQVNFTYDLSSPSDVIIKVFNQRGSLITEITDPGKPAGNGIKTQWNSSQVAPGVYYGHIKITPVTGSPRQFSQQIYIKR